jgi:hypothetical protein
MFGCISFVHNKKKDKFDHASIKIIFLGYPSNKK